jgi:hypothetical protein
MVRTSQCFRTKSLQLDGPPTLAAAEAIPYTLVLPASLIKPERGVYTRDFSRRHKWHSLVSSFLLRARESGQFICFALRFRCFRRQCALSLRPLKGFGKVSCEAKRESKFRPNIPGQEAGGTFRDR